MLLAVLLLLAWFPGGVSSSWDHGDMELFDLVEEFNQNFYHFLSVPQDASSTDIKKAYRRLTLTLHPDKNKDENAETQFRQLVSIYEVLKDEERRQRYDDILVNGLPDWRQPMFYYRRVRKMSNTELGFLLFVILTVGHYAVIWSIYLEKLLDELLSKKKKEKKKKLNSKTTDDSRPLQDRLCDKPHWQDILPLKVSIWLYLSIKSLPQTIQEVKQYYEEYKVMKQRLKEEAEQEEEVFVPREKRPKVKKTKVEFPVYEEGSGGQGGGACQGGGAYQGYDQAASIEDIEEQMNDWLDERKSNKKKSSEWTEEEQSMLSRCMQKFPGGTPGRWEKIAHELGRSVSEVTSKVKQLKECVNVSGLVKLSELKGKSVVSSRPGAGPGCVPDSLMTHRETEVLPPAGGEDQQEEEEEEEEESQQQVIRRRGGKAKGRRRQGDFDPTALEEEEEEEGGKKEVRKEAQKEVQKEAQKEVQKEAQKEEAGEEEVVWTQSQQRLLESALQQNPRGTAQRWDRIAKLVPGKTKEDCMIRYKLLAELVLKRKQAKS